MSIVLIIVWILQIIVAITLLQTLYFKFSGSKESKYIFSKLGLEPWGRYLIGTLELAAAIMLVIPNTAAMGAALSIIIILPAIAAHIAKLGIPIMKDRGLLFGLAFMTGLMSLAILIIRFKELPGIH